MRGPDLLPHATGELTLPAREWAVGETVELSFRRRDGTPLAELRLPVYPAEHFWAHGDDRRYDHGRATRRFEPPTGPAPAIEEETGLLRIAGARYTV
jgi:hypothetical protein